MNIRTEWYAHKKWDVLKTNERGEYPVRVGHIVGAHHGYLAEAGPRTLGYFPTKQAAIVAIDETTKPVNQGGLS